MPVTVSGGGGSKFLPLYTSTLLSGRVSQKKTEDCFTCETLWNKSIRFVIVRSCFKFSDKSVDSSFEINIVNK